MRGGGPLHTPNGLRRTGELCSSGLAHRRSDTSRQKTIMDVTSVRGLLGDLVAEDKGKMTSPLCSSSDDEEDLETAALSPVLPLHVKRCSFSSEEGLMPGSAAKETAWTRELMLGERLFVLCVMEVVSRCRMPLLRLRTPLSFGCAATRNENCRDGWLVGCRDGRVPLPRLRLTPPQTFARTPFFCAAVDYAVHHWAKEKLLLQRKYKLLLFAVFFQYVHR